jgi:hypothetical protein
MAGITMVELGTSKPISALVASSTSSAPAAEQQTTLGRVLTGTAAPAEDGGETTEPGEAEPGQVDDGAGQAGTTDGTSSGTSSGTDGSTGVEDPATGQTDGTTPVESVPEPVPAPGSETGEVAEPEVVTDAGTGQQDAGQETVPDDSGAFDPAPLDGGLTEGDQAGTGQ